jgi:Putative DNA-binding domain
MESGQKSLSELRSRLLAGDGRAFVRLVVCAEPCTVWYLDALAGAPSEPPGWQEQVWRYADASFIAASVPSAMLGAALHSDSGGTLALAGHEILFPTLQEQVSWQRKPSRARHELAMIPWPASAYSLSSPDRPFANQPVQGFLIGDDCPSFASYEATFHAFFYGDFSPVLGLGARSEFGTVRVVDDRGWFERVRVTPASLEIDLGGVQAEGAQVELNSATQRTAVLAAEDPHVSLPLPDGLPRGAWLYLSREREWLDYRAIGEAMGQGDLARTGVEVEVPDDPESVIGALLAAGEGSSTEFKRQLPDDSDDSKRKVFKTTAAFANGNGGNLVFGVESDEATVCGVEDCDLIKARDRLTQLAWTLITPSPVVEVRPYEVDGKTVLVMTVEKGSAPPYALKIKDRVEYYVRRDATTFPARPEDIRASVLASAPQSAPSTPWG